MIHFFIGTKAQFVKLVPVIKEAERQQLDFRLIDAGFHRGLMDHIVQDFACLRRTYTLAPTSEKSGPLRRL